MEKPHWEGKQFSFFSHKDCEYYPCHKVPEGAEFNCLFCYCPLYVLGRDCGGSPVFLENGTKDCSQCLLPHKRESYGYITRRYADIAAAMAQREKAKGE